MKLQFFQTRPMIFTITSLFIVGAFLFISTMPSKSFSRMPNQNSSWERQITVRNFTENLKVVNLEVARDGRHVRLTLRNNHSKTITAFTLGEDRRHSTIDLIDTDKVFAPGAERVEEYDLPQTQEPIIIIQAVVFDDKSAEGNPEFIKKITESRLGEKTQLNLIIPLLESILNAPDAQLGRALETNQSRILQLHDMPESGSLEFRYALKNAKRLVLHHLEELKQTLQDEGTERFRQYLLMLKERYQRKSSIL